MVDGLELTYTGMTEYVNGEQLYLFRCVADHQMWLSEKQRSHPDQYHEVHDTRPKVEPISESEPDNESNIEILLHEKLESDIAEQENVKKELSDLAVIMKDQQRLFRDQSKDLGSAIRQVNQDNERQSFGVATYTAGVLAIIAFLSTLI
ncbi:MAG: hypothetical protein CMO13_04800 [Thaumarchaeota archaeon]|nr:hypothetical protein [Nitrososphaerota archaeon]